MRPPHTGNQNARRSPLNSNRLVPDSMIETLCFAWLSSYKCCEMCWCHRIINIDKAIMLPRLWLTQTGQVCRFSLLYAGRVACCPSPGESRWVCRRDRQTDKRTDDRPLHYAFVYGRDQHNNSKYNLSAWRLTQMWVER